MIRVLNIFLILILLILGGCRNSPLFYTPQPKQYNTLVAEKFEYDTNNEYKSYTNLPSHKTSETVIKDLRKEKIEYKNYKPIPIKLN